MANVDAFEERAYQPPSGDAGGGRLIIQGTGDPLLKDLSSVRTMIDALTMR